MKDNTEKTTKAMGEQYVLKKEKLSSLFEVLNKAGYQLAGPTSRDETIIFDELNSVEDLPAGLTNDLNPAQYRLKKRKDGAVAGVQCGTSFVEEVSLSAEADNQ